MTSSRGLRSSGTKRYKKGKRPTKRLWTLDAAHPLGLVMIGCRVVKSNPSGQAAEAKIKPGYKILAIVSSRHT